MSIGIVVPAYRPDTARLESYLRSLLSTFDDPVVRVELDDPGPETLDAVVELELPVEIATVPYRRGKGAAVTAGFEALDTDRLAFADADGSTPAAELRRVVEALDGADIAVGSRRHPAARVGGHRTFARRFLGDGFAWLARRLLDVALYDYQCGAKALSADAWGAVRTHLYEPGFAWDVELVAVAGALDLRVVECPIEWTDRAGSTVSPIRTTVSMARTLGVARRRANRLASSHADSTRASTLALVDRNR